LTLNGKWGYRVLFLCARCREVINEFSPDWLIRSVPVDTAFYGNYVHWAHGKSMRVVK
jgi:hypothetical protein